MKLVQCDRCNGTAPQAAAKTVRFIGATMSPQKQLDFCLDCYKEFLEWVDAPK